MAMLYHYPQLSALDAGIARSPGPGLGNLLFPIARAIGGQAEHGGVLVYPTMRQFKIGTYLRNEIDKRTYGNVIKPRSGEEWRNWFAARLATRIAEKNVSNGNDQGCIVYAGLGEFFLPLVSHSQSVGRWIEANGVLDGVVPTSYDIAIHIRIADFIDGDGTEDGFNIRQSWNWYRAAIEYARQLSGKASPSVMLFTDIATEQALAGLGIDSLPVDPSRNALTAMVNMAKADIVVTSRSTFSMWGVFLGNSKAIWNRKMAVHRYFPQRHGLDHYV